MTLKPLTCPNCGGAVNRERRICEYCGTSFQLESDTQVFRVEHFTSPTRVLAAEAIIPNEFHALAPGQQIISARLRVLDSHYRF